MHMDQPGRDLNENLDQLRHGDHPEQVQSLTIDIFDQQMQLARSKKPVASDLQSVDLDKIRVVEHLGDTEFVLGLLLELLVLGATYRHDLERILLRIGMPADVQNRTVGAVAQGVQDLKSAN